MFIILGAGRQTGRWKQVAETRVDFDFSECKCFFCSHTMNAVTVLSCLCVYGSLIASSQASARLRKIEMLAFDLNRARSDLDPVLLSKFRNKSIKLGLVNQFPDDSSAFAGSDTRNRTYHNRSLGFLLKQYHSIKLNGSLKAPRATLSANDSDPAISTNTCRLRCRWPSCSCCPWWCADYGPVVTCAVLIVIYLIVVAVALGRLWSSSQVATNHTGQNKKVVSPLKIEELD